MHLSASIDKRELLSYDYRGAEILSVSENGHRLSQRFDFAKVRCLVFAGVRESVLFAKTKNARLDPGDMSGFRWNDDLAVWIRGSNHKEIVRDLTKVMDHYDGHVEIKIRLRSGKTLTIGS
jgi:hypothetical protein